MLDINGALKAIGFGMLVLFFAVGVVKTCSSAADLKRPEHAFKLFIRFALAKAAVTYGLDLMLAIFQIIQGMVSTIITRSGLSGNSDAALPQEIIDKINQVGFWSSIPLWQSPCWRSVYNRPVLCYDFNRLFPYVQALYVYGACTHTHGPALPESLPAI